MLVAASIVLVVLGALHSILGEKLIFRRLERIEGLPLAGFPPIIGAKVPPDFALRATWHNLTIFGWTFALILGRWDLVTAGGGHFLAQTVAIALLISAVLWAVASCGKHIGWLGFLLAAVLTWLGAPK